MAERENSRTEAARRNDDSDLIAEAGARKTPDAQGSAGGEMARAVGTRGEAKRVSEPEVSTGVDKGDERADVKPNETSAT